MTNEKQQTAVDAAELAFKLYPFSSDEVRNAFITGYNKAKEMEKERMIEFARKYMLYIHNEGIITIETFYNETYGGDK
jgi:hypothetical protein